MNPYREIKGGSILSNFHALRGALVACGLLVTSGLAACGGATPSAAVPTRYEGPLAPSADAKKGEAVFQRYCDSCHPGGKEDVGPALAGRHLAPGRVRWLVREGGDTMPAFPADKVSDEDLENLAAYVTSL